MARVCQICGRGTSVGNQITRRGRAKYLGGVGIKTTGVSKRRFRINLREVRVLVGGAARRMRVCSRCIKQGKVVKATA